MALSWSESGNASRRAKLPRANHVYGAGGGPRSASASSINRRVSASCADVSTPLTVLAATRASHSAITASGRRAATSHNAFSSLAWEIADAWAELQVVHLESAA